ncbi:MAG: hypothetical protein LBP30_08535, partial [Clostridiales Family XIII bacterium]|nr:hypothetical protein [Clostridiales Family XIII bacterium]
RLCHRQKPYKKARRHRIRLAPRYEKTVLNLPCSTDLRPEDIDFVCDAIAELGRAGRAGAAARPT